MIKVNASILEDGLVEELQELMNKNHELFKDSEVALMPDAHKTGGIPVGFTMTVPHYRVAPDFISSDVSCGVSGVLIKDFVPTDKLLKRLRAIIRDVIQVDRRVCVSRRELTDMGTLGLGNHFIEIGTDGKDTLISVHSGSRNFGGSTFNKWKNKAINQYKQEQKENIEYMLKEIEPRERQTWIENNKQNKRNIDYVDLSKDKELRNEFIVDYKEAYDYANKNRNLLLLFMLKAIGIEEELPFDMFNTVHNYIDFEETPWVIRKGSIKAIKGETVLIPINMRDGVIMGTVTDRGEFNNSLPHGAGRILSRTAAFNKLSFEDFKNDMKDVISSTVVEGTLDESPRSYKDIDTILKDIGDGLEDIKVFKTLFNYKGVE